MTYPMLPPEVNSAVMRAGAGSGPMLAAATAWTGLAGELQSAASSFASVTSNLAGGTWQGPAAQAMAAAAAPYTAWLTTAASHTQRAASQAAAVTAAFEAAHAATVPTPVIAANRALLGTLANTNLFGQNAPAIAATESQYEDMWAQDVTAMANYHAGASSAWSGLAPLQSLQKSLPKPVAP
jgi:PPE-repeat protein